MQSRSIVILVAGLCVYTGAAADEQDQPLLEIQEDQWVVFYDVPSRRFREIRDAFVRRRFDAASQDLLISASYLSIEADRAIPALAERLAEVSARMTFIAENINDSTITLAGLDPLFGRAHWLLAQHYLIMAKRSRDAGRHRNAGRYLWATTHHLERTVLWSDARISRDLLKALDGLREMAQALQDPEKATQAYRRKPIVTADKVLRDLGKYLDRPVVLPQP